MRALNRCASPVAKRLPPRVAAGALAAQSPTRPPYSAAPPAAGLPASLVDAGPLYAGETVARIDTVRPAAELVRELAP